MYYDALEKVQDINDPIQAMQILKTAFSIDVSPIVAMARYENGNAIDPISTYRSMDYKKKKSLIRKRIITVISVLKGARCFKIYSFKRFCNKYTVRTESR